MTQLTHYRAVFPGEVNPHIDRYSVCTYTHAWQVRSKLSGNQYQVARGFAGSKAAAETAAGKQRVPGALDRVVTIVTALVVSRGAAVPSNPLDGWTMVQRLRRGEKYQVWQKGQMRVEGWPDRDGRPWIAVRVTDSGGEHIKGARGAYRTFGSAEAAARAATKAWGKA